MDASYQNNLVALAGGAQILATQITRTYSRFTVVVSPGDSAVLPPASAGLEYIVKNAAANSMNIYPAAASQGGYKGDGVNFPSGDAINALATNTAFAVAAGKSCRFFCIAPYVWETLLTA